MESLFSQVSPQLLLYIMLVAFAAGAIKGVVGFAMPMVFISGLTIFADPQFALGVLILPTLVTNLWQALRNGLGAVLQTVRRHGVFLLLCLSFLLLATQIVPFLSTAVFFTCLGIVVVSFAVLMLLGWSPSGGLGRGIDLGCAVVAGFSGGIAGVWGPPTVVYLTSKKLSKADVMQVQGVIYGAGAFFLTFGHFTSGVFNGLTAAVGAIAILPAVLGIWIGFMVQDKIDQATFKKAMLFILIVAGLNLIRRGLT